MTIYTRTILIIFIAVISALATSHAEMPDAPSSVIRANRGNSNPAMAHVVVAETSEAIEIEPAPPSPQYLRERKTSLTDKKFVALAAFSLAASLADIESTVRGLKVGGRESNPLLGSHPSRGRIYGTILPFWAGSVWASHHLRARSPQGRLWMVPMLVGIGAHGAAAAWNFHF